MQDGEQVNDAPVMRPVSGIKPPTPLCLDTNIAETWKIFKQKWLNYSVLIKLTDYTRDYQVALLLNTLGDDALRVYNGFQFNTDENVRTVQEILNKFEAFAVGAVNETYERYMFNKRVQQEGESFETCQGAIRSLVKTCNYCANCVSSIIRDRFVLGIRDQSTQQALLKERELTLETCVDICKASENASAQSKVLRPETVNRVGTEGVNRGYRQKYKKKQSGTSGKSKASSKS